MEVITAQTLAGLIKTEAGLFRLIDVREPEEWQICRLPGAELIPLSEFTVRAPVELKKDEQIILYCHHGIRSGNAGNFLLKTGYNKVRHLEGGIDA